MADSREDIASQATGLLRANSVNSFDEGTNEADIMSLFYPDWVLDVLTRYPWSFATKKRLLNQDSTPPINEYANAHIVPSEALRIWALYDSDAVGAKPITKYDISGSDAGRRVNSNYTRLWAEYTVYTNETAWPGYFVHFAIHSLAALTAMPITDQPDLAARMQALAWGAPNENELGGKFGVACKIDAMQKPGEVINSSPLIESRFS
jgi:hypothetical protein